MVDKNRAKKIIERLDDIARTFPTNPPFLMSKSGLIGLVLSIELYKSKAAIRRLQQQSWLAEALAGRID